MSKRNGGYAILDLSGVAWTGTYPDVSGTLKEGTYESMKAAVDSGKPILITGATGLAGGNFNTAFASSIGTSGSTVLVDWLAGPASIEFAISPDRTITYEYND